jgi:hypothetical protein
MEAPVFADHDPEVVSGVLHIVSSMVDWRKFAVE